MKWPSTDQMNLRWWVLYYVIPFVVRSSEYLYVLNECVKWISLEKEAAISVMSCLCSWKKWNAVKILLAKIVCDGRAVRVPPGEPHKGELFLFGGEEAVDIGAG